MEIPNSLYEAMWTELKNLAGEQSRDDVLKIMDSIEKGIIDDYKEQVLRKEKSASKN